MPLPPAALAGLLLAAPAPAAPSFTREVVPLLTRLGCNQGACHGKLAGQNGFRLSLRGYAPADDHRSLTREHAGRRVFAADPARSPLLLKATGEAPHEGGRLVTPGSADHQLLLAWLRAGAPGPAGTEPPLVKLELSPAGRTVAVGDETPLTATALFADGSRRDVTPLAKFETNDAAVATVTAAGVATARRPGATAVRAMYQAEVAAASLTVPHARTVDPARFVGRTNFVDDHVFARLRELRVEPSDGCTDGEFIRRVWLDACGALPPAADVLAFVADPDPGKRMKLVDRALGSPAFTDHWAMLLGDLLQNRRERDHDVRGVKGVRKFHDWLRQEVAANRPWDQLARSVLTARGSTTEVPPVGYFVVTVGEHREAEKSEAGESVAQAFLGTRIGCAKCHNHPLERYTQDDFFHFAAFFSRVQLDRKDPKDGPTTLKVGTRGGKPVGVTQPRTGKFLPPQPLDRTPTPVNPGDDPREQLAKWATGPSNEAFAGAMVNRVWRHYFGVGLVEPVDDLRATNPPAVPGLWTALVKQFTASGYDLRALMRLFLTSRAYALSSATRPGNESDSRFYSHYYARRLPAEVLLDALADVTGVPEAFDGYPVGVRAVQVPDPAAASQFLGLFGRPERVTACACERAGDVTLPQLLHLQNGDKLLAKLRHPDGWLTAALKDEPDDAKLLDALFQRAVGRPAKPGEVDAVQKLRAAGDPRDEVFADLLWAVLNSKEFAFNH